MLKTYYQLALTTENHLKSFLNRFCCGDDISPIFCCINNLVIVLKIHTFKIDRP